MSDKRWELLQYPAEKDPNRWRAKIKADESELSSVLDKLSVNKSRPFLVEDGKYEFGFYIYMAGSEEIKAVREALEKKFGEGIFVEPKQEEKLSEELEGLAAGIDKATNSQPSKAPAAPAPEPAPAAQPKSDYGFEDLELNPRYTFKDFIIGPNNRFTAAAAQAVADNPGKIYNPFFIYSGVGLGKTHMMHAVGHYVRKKNPNLRILYVTTEKFMGEVIDSIRKGSLQQMREHYRKVDLLLVDDIQFLVESESTQEEFFHTFNILHQNGKQIIVTSDRPPKQLTTLEDRLRSRFECGLIADIKSPNLETRVAILKQKGELDHLTLNDNILLYIASKLKSNIRELEGFLKRINAYASLTHQEVNLDLVKVLMSDLLPPEEMAEPVPASLKTELPPPPISFPQEQPKPIQPAQPAPEKTAAPAAEAAPAPSLAHAIPIAEEPPVQASAPASAVPPVTVHKPEPVKEAPQIKIPVFQPPKPQPDAQDANLKPIEVVFFYPETKEAELSKVKEHFKEVIKKHKLKFKLVSVFEQSFSLTEKVNYAQFPELCKNIKISIAVVLGPPPESNIESEEFANLLATIMDDEKLSLQLIPWAELNKDYRYLNLSLDITLLKNTSPDI
ncbi:MAG: chromosomal replication initiator protein DnaA [Elusimicrobia bacterium RIFOXYA1_FULL_47_7]|nr:MAG: chromosomal replication initiator protein DnaA [Elusimicrobia bacterium RIFOXYA1_FULL_47_7]